MSASVLYPQPKSAPGPEQRAGDVWTKERLLPRFTEGETEATALEALSRTTFRKMMKTGQTGPRNGGDLEPRENSPGAGPAGDRPLPPARERLRLQQLTASTSGGCPGFRRQAWLPRKQQTEAQTRSAQRGRGAHLAGAERKGTAQA